MGKILLRGFLGIAPIAITIFLIVWLCTTLEDLFRIPLITLLGPEYYFPGLGMLVALIFIFCVGLIINNWLMQKLKSFLDNCMKKIPLVKTIYAATCDLMGFFQQGGHRQTGQVVVVDLPDAKRLGFVTRDQFRDLPEGIASDQEVAVFLPFSYQIGGMTIFVPKEKVRYIDMSVERALRFIVTAASPGEG